MDCHRQSQNHSSQYTLQLKWLQLFLFPFEKNTMLKNHCDAVVKNVVVCMDRTTHYFFTVSVGVCDCLDLTEWQSVKRQNKRLKIANHPVAIL